MLKEAIQQIQAMAVQAEAIKIIPVDSRTAYLQQPGKPVVGITVAPPLRAHQVFTLDDLVRFAGTCGDRAVVWHADGAVVLILDDDDRRDRVGLELAESEPMQLLRTLAQQPNLDHRQLLRMLRVKLAGCLVQADLPARIAKMDFSVTKKANSSLEHGKESLGRRVEAEVAQVDQIPTEIRVEIPVYRTWGETQHYEVLLSLEILVQEERFLVQPFPGQLEQAMVAAQTSIHERLVKALPKTPVYFGKP